MGNIFLDFLTRLLAAILELVFGADGVLGGFDLSGILGGLDIAGILSGLTGT